VNLILHQILILDSHEFEREKLKINLGTIGKFIISEMISPEEFFLTQKILEGDFSLILIDIAFPTPEEGYKVLTEIKKDPNLKKVPLIVITALHDASHKIRVAKDFGAKDYINKPYTLDRLSGSIHTILPAPSNFFYSFENTDIISMPVEELINQQLSLSKRLNKDLSLIFMTPHLIQSLSKETEEETLTCQKEIYENILKYIKLSIRNTDMVFWVNKTDILVLLHYTSAEGATTVLDKIKSKVDAILQNWSMKLNDLFYISLVTYPHHGENLDALINLAVKKTAEKSALDQMVSVSKTKIENAKASYSLGNKP
jgi:DNA-binding response OmpR family regulator